MLTRIRRKITYSRFFTSLAGGISILFLKIYTNTLKIKIVMHPEFRWLNLNEVCFGFWHGRQLLLLAAFAKWPLVLMTDVSFLGGIQTWILQRLGYHVVRGSSQRNGVRGLISLRRAMLSGYAPALALDGPSGPIYKSKPGLLFLSEKFSYPVIPVTAGAEKFWTVGNTWCRYQMPRPFSRCLIIFGKPIQRGSGRISSLELDRIMMEQTKYNDQMVKNL